MPSFSSVTRLKRKYDGPHPSAFPDPLRLDPVNASPPPPYQLRDSVTKRSTADLVEATDVIVEAGTVAKRRRIDLQSQLQAAPKRSVPSSSSSRANSLYTRSSTSNPRTTRSSHPLLVSNPDPVVPVAVEEESFSEPKIPVKIILRGSSALSQKKTVHTSLPQDASNRVSSAKSVFSTVNPLPQATASTVVKKSTIRTRVERSEEEVGCLASSYVAMLSCAAAPVDLETIQLFAPRQLKHLGAAIATKVLQENLSSQVVGVNISASGAPLPVGNGNRHLPPFYFVHSSVVTGSDHPDASEVFDQVRKTIREMSAHP